MWYFWSDVKIFQGAMPKVRLRKMGFTQPQLLFPSSISRCTSPCSWNNRYLGSLVHPGFWAGTSILAHETVSLYADKCGYRFVLKASPRHILPTKVIRILKIEMSKGTKLLLHSAIPTLPPSQQMPLQNTSHCCKGAPDKFLGNSLSGLNMHIPFSLWSFVFWVVRSFMRRVISSSFVFVSFRWSS